MKLSEALLILRQAPSDESAEPLQAFLACGFTPLHFQTLLAAELQIRFPQRRVQIETGLYGNLIGNVNGIAIRRPSFAAIVIEWPDLDLRLGIRGPRGWSPSDQQDIIVAVELKLKVLADALDRAATVCPLALVLPTLPLPPVSFTPNRLGSGFQLRLEERVLAFAGQRRASRLSAQELDRVSPPGSRWDIGGDLRSGFPYKLAHAAQMASLVAQILCPPAPKKGVITDLDGTLWSGIVGEIGEENISWDLDHHSQHHGLYQLLLRSLAETGVLVAAASKNDPETVHKAFSRGDLLIPAELIFPFEVHWDRKSLSVARILQRWNVGPESVVFVDESPLEVAEVQAAFPAMECICFPQDDPAAVVELLYGLRDRFGKPALSVEDTLRRQSLRDSQPLLQELEANGGTAADLLRDARAEITISYGNHLNDPRPLELVNKTNQFNLNGRRWTQAEWRALHEGPGGFQMVVSYQDNYSTLGKIAVLAGRRDGPELRVAVWVMSCRAFSRQIEYGCLAALLTHYGADRIVFDFAGTERNGPMRAFLERVAGQAPIGSVRLTAAQFRARSPRLYHQVWETACD